MRTSPRIGPEPDPGATPFQNFDQFFRKTNPVSKEAVDREAKREERTENRERRAKKL
jgi:hypothetical protein